MPNITVVSHDSNSIDFDLTGANNEIANSLRRIMMSEVTTMAIKTCHIRVNSTNIPDETLAHRLGLVPIKANPRLYKTKEVELNTIFLRLNVECSDGKPLVVYAKDIDIGDQRTFVDIAYPDIIIAKLVPGQKLSVDIECVKGQGKTHAKWSPVSTCAYRFLPEVKLCREFRGEDARRLQTCFPAGVIELDRDGVARVADARKCFMGTEIERHPDLAKHVVQQRRDDCFVFHVESIGSLAPHEIVAEAVQILSERSNVEFDLPF